MQKTRKIEFPPKEDIHSPAYHPDIKTIQDLKERIEWIKEINGDKPVIIKLGAGRVEEDVRLAVEVEPDAIAIDGKEGGTDAAPIVSH